MDTCPLCALPHADGDPAWSSQREPDGAVTRTCPVCTRAQLWLIEAGLTIATATAPAARGLPGRRVYAVQATDRNAG